MTHDYTPEQLNTIVLAYEKNKQNSRDRYVPPARKKQQNVNYYKKHREEIKQNSLFRYYKKINDMDKLQIRYPDIYEKFVDDNKIQE